MKNENLINASLGQIVTDDFRAASVFKAAGLDFCCGGKKSLAEACSEKNINPDHVIGKLMELESSSGSRGHNFSEWSPSFLADYIVNTHHKYVLKNLPDLLFYTARIAQVHGDRHAELIEVADIFSQINSELLQHLRNEEEVLFPAVKRVMEHGTSADRNLIRSEIDRMSGEHEFAGGALDRINEMTRGYQVPDDACNTYRVTMKLLSEFEDDLHIHVHLENNILFPAALRLADDGIRN